MEVAEINLIFLMQRQHLLYFPSFVSILAVNEEPEGCSCSEMSKSSDSAGAGRIDFGCCCPVASSVGASSLGLSACATKKNALTLLISRLIALKMLPFFVFARHFYKCASFSRPD